MAKALIVALVVGCGAPSGVGGQAPSNRSAPGGTSAIRWPAPERPHFASLCLPAHERCIVTAISADGTTVVGADISSDVEYQLAVRWRAGRMEALGGGDLRSTYAAAVSADGRTIVGSQGVGAYGAGLMWVGDDPPVVLADPDGVTQSRPSSISGDGTVIVGRGVTRHAEGYSRDGAAVRWRDGKPEALRDGGDILSVSSIAVSADGRVVAGTDDGGGLRIEGEQINRLERGSAVVALSGDGRVMVGSNGDLAMRWHDLQPQPLGRLPGASTCEALAVSRDGSRIAGLCQGRAGNIAFLWDDASGMQSVAAALTANGVAPPGWILHRALGISADGVTLVGDGSYGGEDEAWVATLPR